MGYLQYKGGGKWHSLLMHSAGGKGLVKVWLTLGGGRPRQAVSRLRTGQPPITDIHQH